jgi:hypothetical protein
VIIYFLAAICTGKPGFVHPGDSSILFKNKK